MALMLKCDECGSEVDGRVHGIKGKLVDVSEPYAYYCSDRCYMATLITRMSPDDIRAVLAGIGVTSSGAR